jgi:SAM-dependent methyltransferase
MVPDVYSIPGLRAWYDLYVLGWNNHVVWKCPTRALVDHYRRHLSANHLDVGVGSGYLLDRSVPPTGARLVLFDRNPACLATTARRLSRVSPTCVRGDLLDAPVGIGEPFDSIGVNYVLHCLPGPTERKAAVLDYLWTLLRPGGTLFGATLLPDLAPDDGIARWHLRVYNRMGVFGNADDTLDRLASALHARFSQVSLQPIGSAVLFHASGHAKLRCP